MNAKVVPLPLRSRRMCSWSRRLRLGLKIRSIFALFCKAAPPPPWSGKLRLFNSEREHHAASTTVAKSWFLVALSPPRSGKSRRLHLGSESLEREVFDRAISGVAPYPLWSRKSRRLHIGRGSPENFSLVAPSPCWSGKTRRLNLGLESLELAELGRN